MKYLLYLLIVIGGYYGYQRYVEDSPREGSVNEIIESYGSVKASKVLDASVAMVASICNDAEILKHWGSSVSACNERYKSFEEKCKNKIFPNLNSEIYEVDSAKMLISRYRKCTTNF
jgi:hypothetical protein